MHKNEKNFMETLLKLEWQSPYAKHREEYFAKINLWREGDIFPREIAKALYDAKEGDNYFFEFKPGQLFPQREDYIIEIDPKIQFKPQERFSHIKLRLGRFYPIFFFRFLPGFLSSSVFPARVIGINGKDGKIKIDANHPLSPYPLKLSVEVRKVYPKERETGGRCRDWIEEAFGVGPGMEARYDHVPTDFDLDNPESYLREDESEDSLFYKEPRFIGHIDRLCHEHLKEFYSHLLPKEGKLLDLMSSWESHLPDSAAEVIGLGINEEELRANQKLSSFVLKDINKDPTLPFEDNSFDAVICDLSVEYIVKPFQILREIKRILKPGGLVSFSFSNRYFPPKVIKLWIDLHEFERMGYVLELLIRSGFQELGTYSLRGFPRPKDDKWIGCTLYSDPLYVVWGRKP